MSAARLSRQAVVPSLGSRWMLALIIATSIGILCGHFVSFAHTSLLLIRYPFGLDYGEGIVWQQMRNILHGAGYKQLGVFPAIVYHYPPVYHLLVGAIAAMAGLDELMVGRAVSVTATIGTAAITGWLAAQIGVPDGNRNCRSITAVIIGLAFLSCDPILVWAPFMRVDMLACLFSVAGFALAIQSVERPRLIYAASFCFVLAVYTKQTSIAAPAAAFAGLLVVRPTRAYGLAAISLIVGLAIVCILSLETNNNFLRHILLYNINRFRPALLYFLLDPIKQHIIFLGFAIAGTVSLTKRLVTNWPTPQYMAHEVARTIAVLIYFIIKTFMLAMIMKSGASINYFVEWFCPMMILVGVVIAPAIAQSEALFLGAGHENRSIALSVAILLALTAQAAVLPRRVLTPEDIKFQIKRTTPVVELIRKAHGPVISDDMVLVIRAGREVLWEPAITAELGAAGLYDQPKMAQMILQRRFGLFVTQDDRGTAIFNDRYNPPIADAIDAAYPITWHLNGYTIHAPRR